MIWIELSTRVEAEAVEAVAELFSEIGHGGVAVEQEVSDPEEPEKAEVDLSRPLVVKTYLPQGAGTPAKVSRAREALWHLSQLRRIEPLQVTRLAEEDWSEAWKRFFFVQRVSDRVVIKPTWREYRAVPGEVVLELDPGMAFGTGLHPTTRMCLQALEKYVESGMRVLDVGTGSGILAIAAVKLGAASVTALDVDPVAVEVARKNVALNGLQERVQVELGSLPPRGDAAQFHLVLANIIARVIVDLAPHLHEAALQGGLVVASGIITERAEWARGALEAAGLRVVETLAEGDWQAVVCRREQA